MLAKSGRFAHRDGHPLVTKKRTVTYPPASKDAWSNPSHICSLIKERSCACNLKQSPKVEQPSGMVNKQPKPLPLELDTCEEQPARDSTITGENTCSPRQSES